MPQTTALRAHLRELQRYLSMMEREISPADIADEADIVQLKPSADPVFGGLLMRIKKRTPYEWRGYLLVPRRGGALETWTRVKPNETTPIGRIVWPEAAWGFRPQGLPSDPWMAGGEPPRKKPGQEEERPAAESETGARDDDHRRIDRRGDR